LKYFKKNNKVVKRAGSIAGKARKQTEKEIGRSVVSHRNYLQVPETKNSLNQ
jgi:DNA-damage-inducible protein D